MGKKKSGKRQWAKIDTQEVEDYLEKKGREELLGLAVGGVPDADLFFVDKAGEEDVAAAVKAGALPRNRKAAARAKVLRSAAILAGAHAAKPVVKPPPRKAKGSGLAPQQQRGRQPGGTQQQQGQQQRGQQRQQQQGGELDDPWAEPEGGTNAWTDGLLPAAKRPRRAPAKRPAGAVAVAPSAAEAGVSSRERRAAPVPAVEIEHAGCSYNPDPEAHQEAVALAVAAETRKLLDKELAPVAPPRTVDYDVETDELAMLQTIEGGAGGDDDGPGAGGDSGAEEEEVAEGAAAARRRQEAERKTRKDRNREARRREAEEAAAAQRALKAQRRELSELKRLQAEVEAEEAAKGEARLRRQLDRAERLAAEPPKLSKHKFEPMPLQVLTSDELAGSLRRLKPTAMLAKDRFKSFQKRALIEPRRKIEQKKQGKRVEYVHGERAERAAERQAELQELRRAKKAAKKAAAQ